MCLIGKTTHFNGGYHGGIAWNKYIYIYVYNLTNIANIFAMVKQLPLMGFWRSQVPDRPIWDKESTRWEADSLVW